MSISSDVVIMTRDELASVKSEMFQKGCERGALEERLARAGHDEKHAARALDAMASHFCTTDLTDGFCGPRDGKCAHNGKEQPPHRNCVTRARGALQAMASRGVKPIWLYDKTLPQTPETTP